MPDGEHEWELPLRDRVLRLEMQQKSIAEFQESVIERFDKADEARGTQAALQAATDKKVDKILNIIDVGKWGAGAVWAVILLAVGAFFAWVAALKH
jgi:hypothetical protein